MKTEFWPRLARLIYSALYWMDKNGGHVESYEYETAPYCGHYFDGHEGKYTKSHYHESMGGAENKRLTWLFKVWNHSEAGYGITFFPYRRIARHNLRAFYKQSLVRVSRKSALIIIRPTNSCGLMFFWEWHKKPLFKRVDNSSAAKCYR